MVGTTAAVSLVDRPVSESAGSVANRGLLQRLTRPALFEDGIPGIALLAGPANVIMQLGRPGVGYGVMESRVESGRIDRHPIKRARTTFTYLAVATRGNPEQQKAYRKAVTRAHQQVTSTADSPVKYNAFDPELQLWVASCIYRGFEDVHRALYGPIPDEYIDYFYRNGAKFGTTLQVKPDMWPADRDAFEEYWAEGLKKVHIDDRIREHLLSITQLEFVPGPAALLFGRINLFFTAGFLPPLFRDQMRLAWSPRDQRRFDWILRTIGKVNKHVPVPVREAPYRLLLADMRWRIRTGRPLV